MDYSVFDIETNGLIENATKIHCLCARQFRGDVITNITLTNPDEIKNFVLNEPVLVGHNIKRFDVPVLEKLLGIQINARLIDTLGLSWYLYPERLKHGLEEWGENFGIPKPPIVDWNNEPVEVYIHRCTEDVKINEKLFDIQIDYLNKIYDSKDVPRIIGYLMFKLDCAREQEEVRWKLDIEKCQTNLDWLVKEAEKKVELLSEIMPKTYTYRPASIPKVMYKKDGTLSSNGQKWMNLLKEHNLPEYHIGTIKVKTGENKGNPGSFQQIKDWLDSLGWKPQTFKYVKEPDGSQRKIPQISADDGSGICPSVKELYEIEPRLIELEDLFIIRHRIGLLKGFLERVSEDGYLQAQIKGFTNTLRFQHTTIVNLPTIPKKYWEMVRGVLVAPPDHILCGSDMSSLEDNTKQHYMYFFDPEYVKELRTYGFDPHCDMGVTAKKMSKDDECFYKWHTAKKEGKDFERIVREYRERNLPVDIRMANTATDMSLDELLSLDEKSQDAKIKILKPIRLKTKKVNFAGVYGAGPPKLALTANIPLSEAKDLHTAYWKRNKAVKQVALSCQVKTVNGQMWLYNPVSGFWYSLRFDKDRFSTLNQGTGVYCFDTWVRKVRNSGVKLCGQFHDEIIFPLKPEQKEQVQQILRDAIAQTNEELKLNVQLSISMDFGNTYADIH